MLQIRIDDFPFTKPEESGRHNLENFKLFDAVFEKYGLNYVLGVIPRHVTREHLIYLSSNPRVEVALHGINHDENYPNEFREWQTEKDIEQDIRSVKEVWDPLVGPITSYIPPHNVIDRKTVRALKKLGFTDLFVGPGSDYLVVGDACYTCGLSQHWSLPPDLYGRSDELMEAGVVGHLRDIASDVSSRDAWLGLHWTWEMNIGLSSLDEFLGKIFEER